MSTYPKWAEIKRRIEARKAAQEAARQKEIAEIIEFKRHEDNMRYLRNRGQWVARVVIG